MQSVQRRAHCDRRDRHVAFLPMRNYSKKKKDGKGNKHEVMYLPTAQDDSTIENDCKLISEMTRDFSVFTQKYTVRIYIYLFVQNKINVICHHKPFLEGGNTFAAAGHEGPTRSFQCQGQIE